LTEAQLDNFRHEVGGEGLPSYPHPRALPEFWEFPTVSMGLGPIMAIYQAHINRYLNLRHLVDTSGSRVWCFVGDGEMDEPESIGALGVAGREHLDNLIFVVNCNLQRLDGPVRGNGKIIQELEAVYRGAGWNVIKVIWGSRWDALLARDVDGVLMDKMNTTLDGEYQKLSVESGAYIREHFFGPDPRLRHLVDHLTDDELVSLPRGGHDYRKLYGAYKLATEQRGAPTVILAKTVKGWTLGPEIESRNATHQIKKMNRSQLMALRDRLYLTDDIPDSALEGDPPYVRPAEGSDALEYLRARGRVLAGPVPSRVVRPSPPLLPQSKAFEEFASGSGTQSVSTTMVFARLLRNLVRDPVIGPIVAPIVSDEARTFGLESIIAEAKIFAPEGQHYIPVDADLPLHYAESSSGQVLQEGITEAGALAAFTALATSYATWGQPMLPVFLFYSMFGFQRVGDLTWALGDIRGRGILAGCTAGRTTLQGEGLQHDDGHSPLLASVNPAAMIYDASFAYEVAVIMEDAITRLLGPKPVDRFWYLTLYNETYPMPALPEGDEVRQGIVDGVYRFSEPPEIDGDLRATLCFSGPMWKIAQEAQQMLASQWGVATDTWAVTSWTNLRRDALEAERWNRLHPEDTPRQATISAALGSGGDPVVAITDYMRAVPDQVARFIDRPYTSLGTDGFGRSDAREALRSHFEVDTAHLVLAVLHELARGGRLDQSVITRAIKELGVATSGAAPFDV
jgi:pyruvate dehydrogenase E1 component